MKIILFFGILFSANSCFSQTVEAKEVVYNLHIIADSKANDFGSFMEVEYRMVIHDSFIFWRTKVIGMYISFNKLRDFESEEDSFYVKKSVNTIYRFSDMRAYKMSLDTLLSKIEFYANSSFNSKYYQTTKNRKSFFYIDTSIDKEITPFIQYKGNISGVTAIKTEKVTCKLISLKKIQFDLKNINALLPRFNDTDEVLPLPL
ncbi:MAG: hypothetical protein K2X37_07480, partial [Chitinophagaceae bacterium]|nr:hypothetical protein [Chitinophagaceae bacterium]